MEHTCTVCGNKPAKSYCDNCATALCDECCKLEIWGGGAEDLTARYFCPACKDDPQVNPWGARPEEDAVQRDGGARAA